MASTREKGKVEHLVVDTAGFLKNADLQALGESIYTVQDVLREIRDKATKQRLQVLPYELHFREPSAEALTFVTSFSKQTGDYPSLSSVDMKLLALTYQFEKEFVGTEHIRTEPVSKSAEVNPNRPTKMQVELPGFYMPRKIKNSESSEENENSEPSAEDSNIDENKQKFEVSERYEEDDEDYDEEEDDESSWITEENLHIHFKKIGLDSIKETPVKVACLTADFAMQNVLMQLGSHVVSLDGMLIRETRTFILRCFACFKTTSIMTKKFCTHCGNKTLKRVSVFVNEDGEKVMNINFKRPINTRGTKFSLPTPKGGKHAINPLLCADQRCPQNLPSKKSLNKVNPFDPDYVVGGSPFSTHDLQSRAARLGLKNPKTAYFNSRNPNTVKPNKGKR